MANRVTGAEVKEIITTTKTDSQVEPFIIPANAIVTDKLADKGLGDTLLKEIERWLSAHLVAIDDQPIANEKAGDASVAYQYKVGLGLNQTRWGQQVKVLDISGTLANLGKRASSIQTLMDLPTDGT